MKKTIKVNYKKVYNFESEVMIFKSKIESLMNLLSKRKINFNSSDLNFVNPEKSNNFNLYAKINFLLEKKSAKYLFQNMLKQLQENSDIDITISIKYGLKTIKRLLDIFNGKGFFEVNKTDLNKYLDDNFSTEVLKTSIITVTDNMELPDFINEKSFISAELITDDNKQTKLITNKIEDVKNFIA